MDILMANAFDEVFQETVIAPPVAQDTITTPTGEGNAFDTVFDQAPPPIPAPPKTLGGRLQERGGTIIEEAKKGFGLESITSPDVNIPHLGRLRGFRAKNRITGQVLAGLGDIAGEGLKAVASAVTPEAVKETAKDFLKDVGSGVDFIMSAPEEQLEGGEIATKRGLESLQGGFETYQELKSQNPEIAKDIESFFNIALNFPVAFGAKTVGKETFDIVGDVANIAGKKTVQQLDNQIEQEVKRGILKGIKPSGVGKTTFQQRKKFTDKSRNAVENIIAEKNNLRFIDDDGLEILGKIPENLDEMSQSISQTKASVFSDINKKLTLAGQAEVKGSVNGLLDNLNKMKNNGTFQRLAPDNIRNRVDELITKYEGFKDVGLDVAEIQNDIAFINKGTDAFWKNPTFESSKIASLEEAVARDLRKSLDDAVSSVTDGSVQDLKNAYGSLSTIEKDVANAFLREAKGRGGGIISEFGNVFSSTAALQGILTARPSLTLAAGLGKIAVDINKLSKSSDNLVKKMFKNVDELITKRDNAGFNPKSKLGGNLKGRISRAEREGFESEAQKSIVELGQAPTRPTVTERGFQLTPQETAPLSIPPKRPFQRGAVPIEPKTPIGKLTGDPLIDSKIDIALSTPPALRTAEQKLVIDLIKRKK
jgi:hypothetical protein